MEPAVLIYYKCMSCAECLLTETDFISHMKQMHCKILVSEIAQADSHCFDSMADNDNDDDDKQPTVSIAIDKENEISISFDESDDVDLTPFSEPHLVSNTTSASDYTDINHSKKLFADSENSGNSYVFPETCYRNMSYLCDAEASRDMITVQDDLKVEPDTQDTEGTTSVSHTASLFSHPFGEEQTDMLNRNTIGAGSSSTGEQKEENSPRFLCHLCGKTFSKHNYLKKHEEQHMGIWRKRFPCDQCDKSFASSSSLKNHAVVHTGEKRYGCRVCYKCYTEAGSLRRHMKTHTGERPFKCNICDKSFPVAQTLRLHMRLHTGEKPYKCRKCDSRFPDASRRLVHERKCTVEREEDT